MHEKGVHPDTEAFNHLLAAFSASGTGVSASMVHKILSEMNRLDVPYNANTYLYAFELFSRVGSEVRDKICKKFELFCLTFVHKQATVNEFLTVIKAQNIKSPLIYSHLLTSRIKNQRIDSISSIFEEALAEGIPLPVEDWRRGLKFLIPHAKQFNEYVYT